MKTEHLSIQFQTKSPRRNPKPTYWIQVRYQQDKPDPLLEAFQVHGWELNVINTNAPNSDSPCSIHLSKGGSGLFRAWTATEQDDFMAEAVTILESFGVQGVTQRELSPADLV